MMRTNWLGLASYRTIRQRNFDALLANIGPLYNTDQGAGAGAGGGGGAAGSSASGSTPPGGSPNGQSSGGTDDPARLEAQRRLESDAQAFRSLRGRLRTVQGLAPSAGDQELVELISLGLRSKAAGPGDGSGGTTDDGGDDGDDEKGKRKATTIGLTEHKAALQKEREALKQAQANALKAVEAERDAWKAKYLDRETAMKFDTICPDTVNAKAARAAIKAREVPFHFALDEGTGEFLVLDNATGQDYKDAAGRFVTPQEAIASMVKLVPWVATEKVVPGAGSGNNAVAGALPGQRQPQAGPLSSLKKMGQAAAGG